MEIKRPIIRLKKLNFFVKISIHCLTVSAILKDCIHSPNKLPLRQVHHIFMDTTNTSVTENQS